MTRNRKVIEPLDLWIEERERDIQRWKKMTYNEMESEFQQQKESEFQQQKEAEWLRSLPPYRLYDIEAKSRIRKKKLALFADIRLVLPGGSSFSSKDLMKIGRQDLIKRWNEIDQEDRDRKFCKVMNRDSYLENMQYPS